MNNYMLLSRLQMDCEYFLGNGSRNTKYLWAGSVKDQISEMKSIFNSLTEKPEWLSMEGILRYEAEMNKVRMFNNICFYEDRPHILKRHYRGLEVSAPGGKSKYTGKVDFWSETFAGQEFMMTSYIVGGVCLDELDFLDGDDERELIVNRAIKGLTGIDLLELESRLSPGMNFAYIWDDDGDDMGTYAVRRHISNNEMVNNIFLNQEDFIPLAGELYTAGCVKYMVDGEEHIETVEDDKAEFFTVYIRREDGLSEALFDFGHKE